MSTIKNTYDNVESIPEGLESIYTKQDDGSFKVTVEGQVDKGRVDEFRDNNINLRKEIEGFEAGKIEQENSMNELKAQLDAVTDKFSGIDLDEWNSLQAERKANAEKELIEKGDVDALINSRVDEVIAAKQKELATQKSSYDAQVASLQDDLLNYDGQLNTMLVDNELTKIAADAGVRSSAMEDVLSRGRAVFRVEDGQAVAFNEAGRQMYLDDAVTPLNINSWVEGLTKSAPHLFESSVGAGTPQPTSAPVKTDASVNTHDSILAGLAALDK